MTANGRIEIYDTTLRDGAQAAGVSFGYTGKLQLVKRLDSMGVDFIEGGFPGSNQKDADFFRDAGKLDLAHARLAAFGSTRRAGARASEDEGVRKLVEAGTPVITIFGKAWQLHVRDVLRTTTEENVAMIADTVKYLKSLDKIVIFDAEHFYDGYKDSPSVAMGAVNAAVAAGCDTVVLCDTNGGSLPNELYDITRDVIAGLQLPVGIHAHNDGGMAAANSLEAVRAGAIQVQGTVNGFGERCGNANICTIVPALRLKLGRDCLNPDAVSGLRDLSSFVDDLANLRHDARLPYVGRNAFSHKAGMHVDAVQKNSRSFEHIDPEQVGNERRFLLSDGSGRSSVLLKAIESGVEGVKKSSDELREVVEELKDLESKGYAFETADASFRLMVQKVLRSHKSFFELEGFRVIVEKRGHDEPCLSEATIKVRVNDEIEHTAGEGNGPVDALDNALRKALMKFYPEIAKVFLRDFRVRILDPEEATGATTRVLIESSDGDATWGTVGVSANIIEACWEALVDSVEYKLFRDEEAAGQA